MPSFLSKVFGRKKDESTNGHASVPAKAQPKHKASNPSLLEGKFEQVVTPQTPIQTNFANTIPAAARSPLSKVTSRETGGFGLFRSRSRPASPLTTHKPLDELPSLTLALPTQQGDTDGDGLGVDFEGESRLPVLEESAIGARRLNAEECKGLIDACTKVILERGLETLGLMHPHWHSASPDTQRKLISLYIQSLTSSPTNTTAPNLFQKELQETRSPHDVAAVLRWALRHLQLNSPGFGTTSSGDEWEWYKTFLTSERSRQYPPSAFTTFLVPILPKPHLALLLSILELSGSLAAHAEGNGTSWSRLCMMWGVWLLCANRDAFFGGGETGWEEFYGVWDKSGRVLEHLFLARIRDESQTHRMPLRLTELVTHYPYTSKGEESSTELLNRPRFATRSYDALFVRIDTEVEKEKFGGKRKKEDLLKLLGIAFGAELVGLEAEKEGEGEKLDKVDGLWEAVRKAADGEAEEEKEKKPVLSRVFADETIRLLKLLPGSDGRIHLEEPILHRRSGSLSATEPERLNTKQPPLVVRTSPANVPLPPSPKEDFDWAQFTSAGFGENGSVGQHLSKTLLDTDVEVTLPFTSTTGLARRLSRKRGSRSRSRRTSVEIATLTEKDSANSGRELKSRVKTINIIKLDEAFIDFWSDAVVDPVATEWPTFVVAKLNLTGNSNLKVLEVEGKPVRWIILERTYSVPPSPPWPVSPDVSATSHAPEANGASGVGATSPRPSLRSLSASTKKRFSFLGGGSVVSSGKVEKSTIGNAKRKTPKIGEMGEILPEVQEKEEKKDEKPAKAGKGFKAAAIGLGAAVLGGVGVKEAVDAKSEEPAKEDEIPSPAPAEGETLPPAPEAVVRGGDTPGPPIALETSEPAAVAEAAPTPAADEPVTEPTVVLAEAPGPHAVAETEPASIEPLRDEGGGDAKVLEMREVPVVSAPVEELPAPEAAPEPVAESVPEPEDPTPAPVAEAAAEPIEEASPEPVEEAAAEATPAPEAVEEPAAVEPAEEALASVEETAPAPAEEATPEHAEEVQSEPEAQPVPEPAEETIPEPVGEAAREEPVAAAEGSSIPGPDPHEVASAPPTEPEHVASEAEPAVAELVADASHEQPVEYAESHVEETS